MTVFFYQTRIGIKGNEPFEKNFTIAKPLNQNRVMGVGQRHIFTIYYIWPPG